MMTSWRGAMRLIGWGLVAVGASSASACAGDSSPSVSRETLPGGGVHVRNSARGVWDEQPERRWRLIEDVRIGRQDGQGPDVFSMVGAILDDGRGRVWIADLGANELRVFDQSGAFVRTVGRKGDGPGEFSRVASVLLGPAGDVWVDSGRRWEVFDTSGTWLARHPLGSNVGGGVRAWTADGRLLEVGYEYVEGRPTMDGRGYYAMHVLDATGTLIAVDTLPTPSIQDYDAYTWKSPDGVGSTRSPLPHSHIPLSRIGPDGDLWITEGGGTYRIRRQTLEGDTVLIVEREYEAYPVTEADRAAAVEQMTPRQGWLADDVDPSRIPKVYPPFTIYHPAADSTLWVLRQKQEGRLALDVFDREGGYLGEVETDLDLERLSIRSVGSDRIYAVATDEFDVNYVALLRIEKP